MPVPLSLLTAWIAPRWTARRTLTTPLFSAWLVHVAAGLVVVGTIIFAIAFGENGYQVQGLGDRIAFGWFHFADRFSANPIDKSLGILAPALGIEGAHLLIASILMPWGASDEPIKKSFAHSLRQVWLHTSHLVFAAIVISTASLLLSELGDEWHRTHPRPTAGSIRIFPELRMAPVAIDPTFPSFVALNIADSSPFLRADREWSDAYHARAWYLRHEELILVPLILSCIGWWVWGMLRGIGVDRSITPIRRPPTCEFCGYDLTTMPMESRCPECGKAVADSLGPDARSGVPWERRRQIGRALAWWQTWTNALRRPQEFGLSLLACESRTDYRGFVAMHLPFAFFIAAASVPIFAYIKIAQFNSPNQTTTLGVEIFTFGVPIFGTICTLGALAAVLASAGNVGFEFLLRDRRNLLAVSMQASAYLIPYLVLWEFFGAATGIGCSWLVDSQWMKELYHTRGVDRTGFSFVIWFIPNLCIAIYYLVLVRRITRAARWANK